MHPDCVKYLPRKPRHGTADAQGYPVQIEFSADRTSCTIEAALVNFSRNGFQVRTETCLVDGERITLHLQSRETGFRFTLPGIVRWRESEDSRTWLLGCMSEEEVPWETLGELFLHGILAR